MAALLAWDALAPFDRERWAQGAGRYEENPRHGMASDAMERLPPGTSRAAVHALLGPTEGQSYATDNPTDSYLIGTSPFGIDPETLVIEYDSANKVVRWWMERS